jgi:hypothetical protein
MRGFLGKAHEVADFTKRPDNFTRVTFTCIGPVIPSEPPLQSGVSRVDSKMPFWSSDALALSYEI